MSKEKRFKVLVFSSAHEGYRRAGLALKFGENEAEVTQEQYELLGDDSRLTVQKVDAFPSEESAESQEVDSKNKPPKK